MIRGRALEERVRAADQRLVLAEQLRHDHLLGGEVRPGERAEQEREHEDRGEGVDPRPVERRDRQHQRRADRVGEHHRPPRAEAAEHRAARDPEHGEPDQLRADDRAHPRRRAGGDEDEPRQREPGHLRPGRGDDLGRQQRDDRPPAKQRAVVQISQRPFSCTSSPSSSIRPPGRMSLTMSQCTRRRSCRRGRRSRCRARGGRCRRSSRRRGCCACSFVIPGLQPIPSSPRRARPRPWRASRAGTPRSWRRRRRRRARPRSAGGRR